MRKGKVEKRCLFHPGKTPFPVIYISFPHKKVKRINSRGFTSFGNKSEIKIDFLTNGKHFPKQKKRLLLKLKEISLRVCVHLPLDNEQTIINKSGVFHLLFKNS